MEKEQYVKELETRIENLLYFLGKKTEQNEMMAMNNIMLNEKIKSLEKNKGNVSDITHPGIPNGSEELKEVNQEV